MAGAAAARRYARALFQLAQEGGQVDAVRANLATFEDLVAQNAELHAVLLQPLHPAAERRAVLDKVAEQVDAEVLLRHFYAFLIDQRRLIDLGAIRAEYERLADEQAGITKAKIRSASSLDEEQLGRLRRALARRVGGEVEVTVDVDPSLVGGIVATIGDVVYDGSLRTQLAQLRASLAAD
jgi:F-type H+-transporting ATPase subunit delta